MFVSDSYDYCQDTNVEAATVHEARRHHAAVIAQPELAQRAIGLGHWLGARAERRMGDVVPQGSLAGRFVVERLANRLVGARGAAGRVRRARPRRRQEDHGLALSSQQGARR